MQNPSPQHVLLAYLADLELEVDRLRKTCHFMQHEAADAMKRIHLLCEKPDQTAGPHRLTPTERLTHIDNAVRAFAALLRDVREPSGYHPAHDQVIAIAMRPLVEQVFRWQQRLLNAPHVSLRLELGSEYLEWFPARLRHILDNLISNAISFRDANKGEARVTLELRVLPGEYHLRLSDNGSGMQYHQPSDVDELLLRSAPLRAVGRGVGMSAVRLLVGQAGGSLSVDSDQTSGSSIVVVLPRFDVDDFLEGDRVLPAAAE